MHERSSEGASREDPTDLIRRFSAGEADLIGRLYDLYRGEMTRAARRLFRRYRLERAVYPELGMVNRALMALHREARNGHLAWLEGRDDFMRAFHRALGSAIADASRDGAARKRGGAEEHEELDLDLLESHSPDPSRAAQATLDYEALVMHLRSPAHRDVLKLMRTGYSIREIARELGMSRPAVMRAVKQIRSTWKAINRDPRRT